MRISALLALRDCFNHLGCHAGAAATQGRSGASRATSSESWWISTPRTSTASDCRRAGHPTGSSRRQVFPAADVVLIAPADKPIKGSLVVRYRANRHGAKPVLFLGHLDVVEAKREDWSTDPFQLTEKDGWYYGRGTEDMKDGDAAMLETLIRLKREHFVPARDIIVAFTADEEAGGDANGARHFC